MQLAAKGAAMAPSVRRAAARLVLSRVAEAYGRMLLEEGLFQAVRCHVLKSRCPRRICCSLPGGLGSVTVHVEAHECILLEGVLLRAAAPCCA